MGQKIHPKGFRLILPEKHLSNWYATKKFYSVLCQEDFIIRQIIQQFFSEFLLISSINIERVTSLLINNKDITITITCLLPRLKDFYKNIITNQKVEKDVLLPFTTAHQEEFIILFLTNKLEILKRLLISKFNTNISIRFKFLKSVYEDSFLIAKHIGLLLEKRTPFRRIIKQILKKAETLEYKGIKIQLAGRLNGIEIARTEWKRYGKIPLHTLKENIDYSYYPVQTKDGIIGIKVWLLKK